MFRLEGVGGTKSSIPTLASTDRGSGLARDKGASVYLTYTILLKTKQALG